MEAIQLCNMVSEQAQQLLNQAQAYQQQLQAILTQKETLNFQLMEIKKALEEMEKSSEKEIYRISGPILIKTNKEETKKDLKEKEELINLRVKTLEKSEAKIKSQIEGLRAKLSTELSS